MTRHTFVVVILWLVLAGVVYTLIDRIQHPNRLDALGESREVVLKRGPDGHYRADALINNQTVKVLIDTGATGVAITQSVADRLNLKSVHAVRTTTANGDSVGYMVRLASVKVGGVEAKNVSAMIAPNLDGDVLLGMSYLGRMDVRLYKGEMTIKQIEAE